MYQLPRGAPTVDVLASKDSQVRVKMIQTYNTAWVIELMQYTLNGIYAGILLKLKVYRTVL